MICVEPYGTLVDTRGNKIAGFDSIAKKQVFIFLLLVHVSLISIIIYLYNFYSTITEHEVFIVVFKFSLI